MAKKGEKLSEETKRRVSENNARYWLGKKRPPRTDEHKRKISEALTGKKRSEESKRKQSESMKGMNKGKKKPPLTDEHKRKIKDNNARYWKGKKRPKETCHKISLANKGKRNSPNTEFKKGMISPNRGKKRPEISREKHWNWKGGRTKKDKALRRTLEYKQWRTAVFEKDNWTCQICGARSKKGKPIYLEAHHIKGVAHYPELVLMVDNGKTLCINCHGKTDNYRNKFRDSKGRFVKGSF